MTVAQLFDVAQGIFIGAVVAFVSWRQLRARNQENLGAWSLGAGFAAALLYWALKAWVL